MDIQIGSESQLIGTDACEDLVGATVLYEDPGIWGYVPRQQRAGVIVEVRDSAVYGRTYLIRTEGFNLPRRVKAEAVTAFATPEFLADVAAVVGANQTAETTAASFAVAISA